MACESLAIRYRACETLSAETDPQDRDKADGPIRPFARIRSKALPICGPWLRQATSWYARSMPPLSSRPGQTG